MVKSVGEDGFCLGKGECLGCRDLGRRARLRQEYEAIRGLRVATVEIPVENVVSSSNI